MFHPHYHVNCPPINLLYLHYLFLKCRNQKYSQYLACGNIRVLSNWLSVLFSVLFLITTAIYQLFRLLAAHWEGDFRELSIMTMDSLSLDVTASSGAASCKHYWMMIFNLPYCTLNDTVIQGLEFLWLWFMKTHLYKKAYTNFLKCTVCFKNDLHRNWGHNHCFLPIKMAAASI